MSGGKTKIQKEETQARGRKKCEGKREKHIFRKLKYI